MSKILAKWPKQPGEILDYDVSFADFLHLRDDTILDITKVTVDVPTGMVLEEHYFIPDAAKDGTVITNGAVKLMLSGGVDGTDYKITVMAVTVGNREKHGEITIQVREI